MIEQVNINALNSLIKRFNKIADLFEFKYSTKDFNSAERNILKKLKANMNYYLQAAENDLAFMEKRDDLEIITMKDKEYPALLRNIYDPPPVLYFKGMIPPGSYVAIVGSRIASRYGLQMAFELARQLVQRGVVVVSGLASGIDTFAHKGALSGGGMTIAVLGSGLLNIYPDENKKLSQQIAGNGGVISEFSLHQKPDRFNFPRRNRVISGLSMGTVIVEAGNRSGALITASCALEQGRDVFAVPGQASSPQSAGTNRLIQNGAKLVQDVDDILNELNIENKNINRKKVNKDDGKVREKNEKLTPEEEIVLKYLNTEPQFIDRIFQRSKIDIPKLERILMFLEIKGYIEQLPGHKFRRI